MANPSLAEYIAQSQRGLYQSVFGPGFMKKAGAGIGTPFTVDTATGIFNTTYGRKVWQALNNQTRFFNAIPRVVWGTLLVGVFVQTVVLDALAPLLKRAVSQPWMFPILRLYRACLV